MNVQEIENEVQQLKPEQLKELVVWFDEYRFKLWDEKIERDAASGRLDNMIHLENLIQYRNEKNC